MGKTFEEEFAEACRRIGGNTLDSETDRVHRDAVRDRQHAFRNVDIKGPDPWKGRHDGTGLTL